MCRAVRRSDGRTFRSRDSLVQRDLFQFYLERRDGYIGKRAAQPPGLEEILEHEKVERRCSCYREQDQFRGSAC